MLDLIKRNGKHKDVKRPTKTCSVGYLFEEWVTN